MTVDIRAIEEWKLLQAIIARQEEFVFRIRGFDYALLTAFSAGVVVAKIPIDGWIYLATTVAVTSAFLWMELAQRVGLKRAIERSKAVEFHLRTSAEYRGPLLADSLTKSVPVASMFRHLFANEMIWVPLVAQLIALCGLAFFLGTRTLPPICSLRC